MKMSRCKALQKRLMAPLRFCALIVILSSMICIGQLVTQNVNADEGMFPISELERLKLSEKGLRLTPEQIFSADKTCLVDGICRVNGCTGSFVSPRGLIITNHHCAYRAIQAASSTENDYLKDGFIPKNPGDEIPAPGYTVRVTESFEDVSERVLSAVTPDMSYADQAKAYTRRRKEIEKQAELDNPGKRAEVAEMFAGKTYVLFVYTFIKDVRLVFAPPSSVGNFGGDVDNWEWPRHTGDFSFMRAYVSPDGSTADYSPNNVPYQPKKFIQVSAPGVNEGDFVMLLGYPGRTARHKTASFLRYEQTIRLPYIVDLYGQNIETMNAAGAEDRGVAIKLLSRIRSLANVEKRSRGQLKGLTRANIVALRAAEEAKLQSFIESDPKRNSKYGRTLAEIDAAYEKLAVTAHAEANFQNLRLSSQLLGIAYTIYDSAIERAKSDLEREAAYMDRNFDQTVNRMKQAQRDLDLATDRKLLTHVLERYAKNGLGNEVALNAQQVIDALDTMYEGCKLDDPATLEAYLKMTPEQLRAVDDPFMKLMVQIHGQYVALREMDKQRSGELSQLYGNLITIKQEFQKSNFVPDANATLRLTHGTVRGYSPNDAVWMQPATTLSGVIAKTTGDAPFETPTEVVRMHEAKNHGNYAHPKLNDVPVAILYDTDTTGGNSGSPILNADGQLVGVNFDRAFEATINDFAWNTNYSRSIGVDIRYVLWITDNVYGAKTLISEMGL